MDESCSIQAPSSSCIKKNETTEVVSQKSNFEGSPHPFSDKSTLFLSIIPATSIIIMLCLCFICISIPLTSKVNAYSSVSILLLLAINMFTFYMQQIIVRKTMKMPAFYLNYNANRIMYSIIILSKTIIINSGY